MIYVTKYKLTPEALKGYSNALQTSCQTHQEKIHTPYSLLHKSAYTEHVLVNENIISENITSHSNVKLIKSTFYSTNTIVLVNNPSCLQY
jgi:hypothetical protein